MEHRLLFRNKENAQEDSFWHGRRTEAQAFSRGTGSFRPKEMTPEYWDDRIQSVHAGIQKVLSKIDTLQSDEAKLFRSPKDRPDREEQLLLIDQAWSGLQQQIFELRNRLKRLEGLKAAFFGNT